jgi:hypothetical protein
LPGNAAHLDGFDRLGGERGTDVRIEAEVKRILADRME